MPVRRLGAGHDLTCERAYSGYELLIRLFRMQEKTEKCNLNIKHLAQSRMSAKYSNSTFLAWGVLYEYLQCFVLYVNYNTVSGEASHNNKSCYSSF
jgi:hypothetical protein